MSDTPRTDAAIIGADYKRISDSYFMRLTTLCRQLERELAAAQKDTERYRWLRLQMFFTIREWGTFAEFPDGMVFAIPVSMEKGNQNLAIDAAIDAAMNAAQLARRTQSEHS